jgi:hypothetical protein
MASEVEVERHEQIPLVVIGAVHQRHAIELPVRERGGD